MGLGFIGAGGAVGAQNALQRIQDAAIAEELRKRAAMQQEFQNALALRRIAEDEASGGVSRDVARSGMTRADRNFNEVVIPNEQREATAFDQKQNLISGLSPTARARAILPTLDFEDVASPDEITQRSATQGRATGMGQQAAFDAGGKSILEQSEGIRTMGDLRRIGAQTAAQMQLARQRAALDAQGGPSTTATNQDAYKAERSFRVVQAVDELMGDVGNWTTGFGSLLDAIPTSAARDFAAKLKTLKGNIAFNELTEMRAASKTGGALGAVSDKEIGLLESALGALDTGQSPGQLRKQLGQIKSSIQRWEAAKAAQSGGGDGAVGAPNKLSVEELLKKYGGG